MDKDNVGIVIYRDSLDYLAFLSREEKGEVVEALLEYAFLGKEPELSDRVSLLVFTFMKNRIDRDRERYEKRCEANRKNGSLGGRPGREAEKPRGDEVSSAASKTERKDSAFEEFWQEYPKKADERAAREEFCRAADSPEAVSDIMKALKKEKRSEEWTRENGRFIPRASAWLSRRGWEAPPKEERFSSFDEDEFFAAAIGAAYSRPTG